MSASVHGHDVIHFIIEQGDGLSRAALAAAVIAHFGVQARFHTCSAQDLSAEQLIDLLTSKGKLVESANGLRVRSERICRH